MIKLSELTLTKALKALKNKEFSAVELVKAFLNHIENHKDEFNIYITKTEDLALKQAAESDKRLRDNKERALEGLPIAIKDIFCTKGIKTTAASKILENFIPPYESTVTKKLFDAGAICLGKTNMDEFAMGSFNTNSAFGPVTNPWYLKDKPNKRFIPGGSSGGSAAAVAGYFALAATGTDTGGSVRQPAAFCGITGIKPTYGLCSRFGIIAYASSFDQAGPLTINVEDAALMLSNMAGFDPKDSTSVDVKIPKYLDNLNPDVKNLRVGIIEECFNHISDDNKKLLNQGIEWLKSEGASIHNVHLKTLEYALPVYYILTPAEASSNLARYDGVRYGFREKKVKNISDFYEKTRGIGFGKEVKRRILIGTYVLSAGYYDAYYTKAQDIRKMIKHDFENIFSKVDVLLTPTAPTEALAFDEEPTDCVSVYNNDFFTVIANLGGLPAISVPTGFGSNRLPLSLQLIGPALSEQRLFNVGYALEENSQFHKQEKTLLI
ncbi:MAG: Asp-tRNA(Asn)/Glu-tRNA(Gln) amidotransferase subunit GatA [Alphaproteobacteria bacterium]